jgi:hypothetical protein|tara:strand:+ start:9380 stop:9961 length:582 start_codon:yes stop_codon:yes gene_type:complete
MSLSADKLEKNWETFEKLVMKSCGDAGRSMLDALGERMIMCPSSMRSDQVGAHPGGMIQNSLDVTMQMRKLNESIDLCDDVMSILRVGLLHDLGKVGDESDSLFVEQDSEWHREKLGQMYKYNENLRKMSVSHRTLYLLQRYGIPLSQEEWIAIQLAQGSHFEENRFYVGSESSLGILIQQSKTIINHIFKKS